MEQECEETMARICAGIQPIAQVKPLIGAWVGVYQIRRGPPWRRSRGEPLELARVCVVNI
jgi:hypothetical protein